MSQIFLQLLLLLFHIRVNIKRQWKLQKQSSDMEQHDV